MFVYMYRLCILGLCTGCTFLQVFILNMHVGRWYRAKVYMIALTGGCKSSNGYISGLMLYRGWGIGCKRNSDIYRYAVSL